MAANVGTRSTGVQTTSVLPFGLHNLYQLFTGVDVPDPITFVIGEKWLNRPNLYPRQATLLKIIFLRDDLFTQFDLGVIDEWEEQYRLTGDNGIVPNIRWRITWLKANGYKWFREVLLVMGRRAGKGHVASLALAYVLWNYMSKSDPQAFYGIDRDKRLTCLIFAGKRDQAKATVFADIYNVITGSTCFMPYISTSLTERLSIYAPNDFLRMKKQAERGLRIERDMATFEILPKESTLMAGRGPTSFMQAYDEMAHIVASGANRSADEVYCLDPNTRVLTADLTWVRIDSLEPGDALVALDEHPLGGAGAPRKLREARVLSKWDTEGVAYRITLEDGSSVVCSGNHRWLRTTDAGGGNFKWATINKPAVFRGGMGGGRWAQLKVGDSIRHLVDPWTEDLSREGGYLSGVFDGEGHIRFDPRNSMRIGFAQNPGLVSLLDAAGFNLHHNDTKVKCQSFEIQGIADCFRFLGTYRPLRLMHNVRNFWQGRAVRGRGGMKRVVSIEELPAQRLVDIETTTGTFIAEGLVSHNSASKPSLDQFGKDAFIIEPSSPWQMLGQFYANYQEAIAVGEDGHPVRPNYLMLQLASWDIYEDWERAHFLPLFPDGFQGDLGEYAKRDYPLFFEPLRGAIQVFDDEMVREKQANPETFAVEREAHFATALDAYLNEEKVLNIFRPWLDRPEKYGPPQIVQQTKGLLITSYKGHADPSKVNDKFGYALAHAEYDELGRAHCLSGETRYLTADGVKTLAETSGTTQRVLTSDHDGGFAGLWQDAEIRSFGEQRLWAVTLRRNKRTKVIYATDGHRWIGRSNGSAPRRQVLTTEQMARRANFYLTSTFPEVPEQMALDEEAIRHGMVFGDGRRARKKTRVTLWGQKDAQMLRYFEGYSQGARVTPNGVDGVDVGGLPGHFKDAPDLALGDAYLRGWLAGYFAADGCVSKQGQVIISSARREHLELVRDVANRLGVGTYGIQSAMRVGFGLEPTPIYKIELVASTLRSEFFLITAHRERFEGRKTSRQALQWAVVSVEPTDRVEEVYCAVVPGTQAFVLEDNILTGNCVFDLLGHFDPADFPDHIIDYEHVDEWIWSNIITQFYPDEFTFDQYNCLDETTLVPTDRGLLTVGEIVGPLAVGATARISETVQSQDLVATAAEAHHRGVSPVLSLTTKHGVNLRCTAEHRVWVRRARAKQWHRDNEWEWLRADQVSPGDHVRLRLGSVGATEPVRLSEFHPTRYVDGVGWGRHSDRYWMAYTSREGGAKRESLGLHKSEQSAAAAAKTWYDEHPSKASLRVYPETLDAPLAQVLGLLVAEGNVEQQSAVIGNKDRDVLQQVVDDLTTTFGPGFSYAYDDNWLGEYQYGDVSVGPLLAQFFKDLGADDVPSQEKVVPWSVRRSPQPVQAAFLRGLFEGDGGVNSHPVSGEIVQMTTTSDRLGIEVQQMLHGMGILTTRWAGHYTYRGERRRQWRVKVFGPDILRFREVVGFLCPTKSRRLDDTCALIEAKGSASGRRGVSSRGDDWYFDRVTQVVDGGTANCYDLGVPGPHNFVANGLVVHNSASSIQRLTKKVRQASLPKHINIFEKTATRPYDWMVKENSKAAINLGLVHAPYNERAELELRFLQLIHGRVDHPSAGPVQSKDIADAMAECIHVLIGEQIQNFLHSDLNGLRPGMNTMGSPFPQMDRGGQEEVDPRLSAMSGFGARRQHGGSRRTRY